ncbi:MAG: hypothetical protein QM733_08815 [Ilumatobacteraceae bacterium]
MSTSPSPSPVPGYVQRMSPTVAVALSEQRIRGEKPSKPGESKASTNQ